MSVLAVCAASVAILASAACKKDEPASETNTTSAPITPDQPVVTPQTPPTQTPDQTSTGTVNDSTQQQSTKSIQNGQNNAKSTTPSGGTDLIDRGSTDTTEPSQQTPSTTPSTQQPNQNGQVKPQGQNHSTSLGDGKSGTYTDNKGTNGGKATWGTGPKKDTKMDQPTH